MQLMEMQPSLTQPGYGDTYCSYGLDSSLAFEFRNDYRGLLSLP